MRTHTRHSTYNAKTTSLKAACAIQAGCDAVSKHLSSRCTHSLSMILPFGDLQSSNSVVISHIAQQEEDEHLAYRNNTANTPHGLAKRLRSPSFKRTCAHIGNRNTLSALCRTPLLTPRSNHYRTPAADESSTDTDLIEALARSFIEIRKCRRPGREVGGSLQIWQSGDFAEAPGLMRIQPQPALMTQTLSLRRVLCRGARGEEGGIVAAVAGAADDFRL